ncbi:hypothetical protein CVS42_06250 [Aeromonas veronii]|uniref:Ig-like domain-containing protein n=1 Tax=Aeromonas veronii TaxID=654 RepID=UPI000C28D934|nr:Ig-like domain-containing protein [Aeromonas veronii]ATY80466.1 hypothetical protein CVS42_06250 [Aeromonas veronii]
MIDLKIFSKNAIVYYLMISFVFLIIGCSRGHKNISNIPPNAVVTHMQITPAVSSLAVGLEEPLTAEVTLSDQSVQDVTADHAVSWSSSDPAIATIGSTGEDKGVVKGISPGVVTITASGTANGQTFTATAQVTITNAVVTHMQITPAVSSLAVGLEEPLTAEVTLSDQSVQDVTADHAVSWSSSDPAIATIGSTGEDKGVVKGISPGVVTITASGTANGQTFTATAQVEVKSPLAFFTTPDTITRDWNDADAYCKGLPPPAARLPTRAELQNLFIHSTSATVIGQGNDEMCSINGWPLLTLCGGSSHGYWTSEANGVGKHWFINMYLGYPFSTSDTNYSLHVTCIR